MCRRWCVLLGVLLVSAAVLAQGGGDETAWRHSIAFSDDPFQSWTSPAYIKFTIITTDGYDPNVVYFQDSRRYEFHYDFALEWLDPFIGMTIEEFDAVTLHADGQQAVLGAVILPPWREPAFNEYGIQLTRHEAYSREEIVRYFHQIKDAVVADPNVTAYYFPTYEQYPVAQQNRQWLEDQGVLLGSTGQWAEGNTSYVYGWALGTLKFVTGSAIQAAYTAGDLRPDDLLLTDGVPAEVPSVAGIVTLAPATPNSHVAILARAQEVPFVHLAEEFDRTAAQKLVGHDVYLSVAEGNFGAGCQVKLLDAGSLDPEDRAALLALKDTPPLTISPMIYRGRIWADTNDLAPADISGFGGKAANFGILRRAIPDHSPRAMAFSFDLWSAFLDRPLSGHAIGATLREEIGLRLSPYTTYPPAEMQNLSADLATIRDLFTNAQQTSFGSALESVVLDALTEFGFDATRKIRFRSSTNVEDSDRFTGAGLYDSFSGCLADDLDDDADGPCGCDPTEGKERGVLRAIRKVFASFYNDNAFLERLKHGLDEGEVGMALLVHHSFPDEIELANGVATMQRSHGAGWDVEVVCQKGAVSVTNPPPDAVPEEVRINAGFTGPMPWVMRRSSLVSLREDTVLEWEAEYIELYNLLATAAQQYCKTAEKEAPVLDLEFKKIAPDGTLVIKQIREIPRPGAAEYATPFMLGVPCQYRTLQGRGGNVFTNHRLKSRWTLRPKTIWLSEANLQVCLYDEAEIEYASGGQVRRVTASLAELPDAQHIYEGPQWDFDQYDLIDSWRFDDLCNRRTYRLRTTPLFRSTVPDPIVTADALRIGIEVDYDQAVPLSDVEETTTEGVAIYRPWEPTEQDYQSCSFDDPNTGVSIVVEFHMRWSWDPSSPTSIQFARTRIEGLTNEPIILTDFFSQSVGGGAHLCPKNFLFEPALEPGLSEQILDELRANNIRLIYYTTGARECRPTEWEDSPPQIRFYGFDEPIEGADCAE